MASIYSPWMRNLVVFLSLLILSSSVSGQSVETVYRIIPAPENPGDWEAWRDSLQVERDQMRKEIRYDDRLYSDPAFAWAAECYHIYFLMLFDESFYDRQHGNFRVENFIQNTEKKFGKIDGVVLWHAYPRIGVDPRNQFDHYRDFPGGLEGLKEIVEQFHAKGIRVFIDYNPWDTGTRREGRDDVDVLIDIVRITGVDGIFLDTLTKGGEELRAGLDEVKPGVVLESELALPTGRIYDHHMSWAQWFEDSKVPGVLWNKWFERRHMMHQIKRWDADHISELHTAWMNGSGMLIWENVFGTWRPWSERDQSWIRLMGPVQRKFTSLFKGEGWTPLYPVGLADVYASCWYDDHRQLWTIINRSDQWRRGVLIRLPMGEIRAYDVFKGKELIIQGTDSLEIRIELPPHGLGGILVMDGVGEEPGMKDFMEQQRINYSHLSLQFVSSYSPEILIGPPEAETDQRNIPEGMVFISQIPDSIKVTYRQRECGFYEHAGYIPPPDRIHQMISFEKPISLDPYAIDLAPVTNQQFYEFMLDSNYHPQDPLNFLKHWLDGKPPADLLDHPVVYVSLEDARAYADWAGKRLPREEEWQLAAQGIEGLTYPWGYEFDPEKCNHGQSGGTTPVGKFPEDRSPVGCCDMCGNVWEWTESERSDGHTRYVILKGGSWFEAEGSDWYFQGGPQPSARSSKYILFWPGMDRGPAIGFRCVVDVTLVE